MMEQRSELFAALVQGNEQDFPEDGVEYSTASEDRQQLLYSQGLKIVSNSVRTNEWNASVRVCTVITVIISPCYTHTHIYSQNITDIIGIERLTLFYNSRPQYQH